MLDTASAAREANPSAGPRHDDGLRQAGFDPRPLAGLCQALHDDVRSGLIPGAVLHVQRQGRVALSWAAGWCDAAARRPMREDSLFRIFSMTKPLTSVAALMLVEQRALALEDEVCAHLAAFQRPGITVLDLLMHASGLSYGPRSTDPAVREAYARLGIGVNPRALRPDALVRGLAQVPLVHPPGQAWLYGSSTDLLGVLVEAVAGERLGAFLQRRLFAPLGMAHTGFSIPVGEAQRVAQPFATDPISGQSQLDPDRWFEATFPPVLDSGGAGAISTAADYARFAQWLLDRLAGRGAPLLRTETVRAMMTDQLGPRGIPHQPGPGESALQSPGYGFGYGLAVKLGGPAGEAANLPGSPGSCLWSGTAGTFFWIDPVHEVVAVYMSQAPGARRVGDRRRVLACVHEAIVP
jgi:CubicO group peptidase (beta-lactamase class C family)